MSDDSAITIEIFNVGLDEDEEDNGADYGFDNSADAENLDDYECLEELYELDDDDEDGQDMKPDVRPIAPEMPQKQETDDSFLLDENAIDQHIIPIINQNNAVNIDPLADIIEIKQETDDEDSDKQQQNIEPKEIYQTSSSNTRESTVTELSAKVVQPQIFISAQSPAKMANIILVDQENSAEAQPDVAEQSDHSEDDIMPSRYILFDKLVVTIVDEDAEGRPIVTFAMSNGKEDEQLPVECGICQDVMLSSKLTKHLESHLVACDGQPNEKSYKCLHCKDTYKDWTNLAGHTRIHLGIRPYVCTECKTQYFCTKADLAVHITCEHEQPNVVKVIKKRKRNFICKECHKTFDEHCQLKKHIDSEHRKTVKICALCGWKCMDAYALGKHHIEQHSNIKYFECHSCRKLFTAIEYLDAHKASQDCCDNQAKRKNIPSQSIKNKANENVSIELFETDDDDEISRPAAKQEQQVTKTPSNEIRPKTLNSKSSSKQEIVSHHQTRSKTAKIQNTPAKSINQKDKNTTNNNKKPDLDTDGLSATDDASETSSTPVKIVKSKRLAEKRKRQEDQQQSKAKNVLPEKYDENNSVVPKKYVCFDELIASVHEPDKNGKPLVKFSLTSNAKKGEILPLECGICEKVMHTSNFAEHLKIHLVPGSSNTYQCLHCDETYRDWKYLAGHTRRHFGIKPYQCSQCKIFFCTRQDLNVHHRRRHRDRKFACDMCDKTFSQNTDLKRHRECSHEKMKQYQCEQCPKAYYKNFSLQEHIRAVHMGKRRMLECPVCGMRCHDSHKMANHRKVHLYQNKFKCKVCNVEYTDLQFFDAHKRSLQCRNNTKLKRTEQGDDEDCDPQQSEDGESEDEEQQEQDEQESSDGEDYEDGTVPQRYMLYDELIASVVGHDDDGNPIIEFSASAVDDDHKLPIECGICQKIMKRKKLLEHWRSHLVPNSSTKLYACLYCDESYKDKRTLAGHTRLHLGIKPYGCEVCKMQYATKHEMYLHNLKRHQQKDHICDACGKCFLHMHLLKQHYEFSHENIRKYCCEHCPKSYKTKFSLQLHVRHVHLGVPRILECMFCGLQTRDTSKLARHRREVHLHQTEFKCPVCSKDINDRKLFVIHRRSCRSKLQQEIQDDGNNFEELERLFKEKTYPSTESAIKPFECPECNLKFSTQHEMYTHTLDRHPKKDHICDVCGKCFVQNHMLKQHYEYAHENIKRFKCDHCSKMYKTKFSMKLHIRHCHMGVPRIVECIFCGMQTRDTQKLARHRRELHLNQMEFECNICGIQMTNRKLFIEHRRQCRNTVRLDNQEDGSTQDVNLILQENLENLEVTF